MHIIIKISVNSNKSKTGIDREIIYYYNLRIISFNSAYIQYDNKNIVVRCGMACCFTCMYPDVFCSRFKCLYYTHSFGNNCGWPKILFCVYANI